MLTVPAAYKIKNDALAKQPVYVIKLVFAGGVQGTDGVNDIYFTSCDISNVLNFPFPTRWFPFLQADSISGISQNVDPINGVSTIGTLTAKLTDYGGKVSDIIKAADAAGYGLRRQRIEVFLLFKGMDWADRLRVRVLQVDNLKLSHENEYTLSASDIQMQLRKTVFNPGKSATSGAVAATGAVTIGMADARPFLPTTTVFFGTCGFVKIDSEIMRWTSSTNNPSTLTVPLEGRGLFSTVAAAHAPGATVDEIIYLDGNPITIALGIMQSSGVAGAKGVYDVYPKKWGCGLSSSGDVDQAGWFQIGELLTGLSASHLAGDGLKFQFVLNKGVEAKKFIEDSLLKIIGAYGFVRGDGSYSIRAYNDLANAAKENAVVSLTTDNVISWGDLTYNYQNLANELWIDFDEQPKLSGKYIRASLFVDSVSQKKWGSAKQLKYAAQGIKTDSDFISQLYQRFQRVLSRYSRPPMQIPLILLPSLNKLEIGDIVRITLPIRDLFTGTTLDRAFEITSTQLQTKTGEINVTCIAQPELANFWFDGVGVVASVTISPASTSIPNGGTQQLVARTFDAGGVQVPTPAISWVASGNVTVSSTGLVTATGVGSGTVYAVSGAKRSNVATITVTTAANLNTVSAVAVSPSTATIAATQTQLATAVAKDIAGNQVNSVTFNWASSVPGVATVPAGPSVSATITAVANGTANITATETVSGIVSPVVLVTVATPVTPTYTPPAIADSAYKIGTQITSMGPVNGPHVIPNGYNFVSGDYWFDGDLSLALDSTCTINGTVRIFSLGVVTINGQVDGVGRGGAGAVDVNPSFLGSFSGINRNFGYRRGQPPDSVGFVGQGGNGGSCPNVFGTFSFLPLSGGVVPASVPQATPGLTISFSSIVSGSWAGLTGLPVKLSGSGGGSGCAFRDLATTNLVGSGMGAAGGAGLLICARGIYMSVGSIDLQGANPGNAYLDGTTNLQGAAGSGTGGGGSFVALAEANVYGLPVISIDPPRVYVAAGAIPGLSASYGYAPANNPYQNGFIGTPGCSITQVIG
jgi:hypothetical protein